MGYSYGGNNLEGVKKVEDNRTPSMVKNFLAPLSGIGVSARMVSRCERVRKKSTTHREQGSARPNKQAKHGPFLSHKTTKHHQRKNPEISCTFETNSHFPCTIGKECCRCGRGAIFVQSQ